MSAVQRGAIDALLDDALRNMEKVDAGAKPDGRYYVYELQYPDGVPFYIGEGQGDRIDDHEKEARAYFWPGLYNYRRKFTRNVEKLQAIKKTWDSGQEIIKKKVAFFDTKGEAFRHEQYLIYEVYGIKNLTNKEASPLLWRR